MKVENLVLILLDSARSDTSPLAGTMGGVDLY